MGACDVTTGNRVEGNVLSLLPQSQRKPTNQLNFPLSGGDDRRVMVQSPILHNSSNHICIFLICSPVNPLEFVNLNKRYILHQLNECWLVGESREGVITKNFHMLFTALPANPAGTL